MYCLTFTYISNKILVNNYSAIDGNEVVVNVLGRPTTLVWICLYNTISMHKNSIRLSPET